MKTGHKITTGAPQPFLVRIGTKQAARLEFYDVGHSSGELVTKHLDAAQEGESVRVFPAALTDADRDLAEKFAGPEPFSLPSQVGQSLGAEFSRIFGSKA